jgi:hypothetical protein
MMREARAQHADFTGAGDVDQLGLKALEHFADEGHVAQKRRIEAEVFFKSNGEEAARQLEGPHAALFRDGLGAVPGADAKEREIAPAREGLKLAAGVRDAIHFVKGVREKGDAGKGRSGVSGAGDSI